MIGPNLGSLNSNPYMKGIGSNAQPQGHRFFNRPQQSNVSTNAMSPSPQWMNAMFGGMQANTPTYSNPNISGTMPGNNGIWNPYSQSDTSVKDASGNTAFNYGNVLGIRGLDSSPFVDALKNKGIFF